MGNHCAEASANAAGRAENIGVRASTEGEEGRSRKLPRHAGRLFRSLGGAWDVANTDHHLQGRHTSAQQHNLRYDWPELPIGRDRAAPPPRLGRLQDAFMAPLSWSPPRRHPTCISRKICGPIFLAALSFSGTSTIFSTSTRRALAVPQLTFPAPSCIALYHIRRTSLPTPIRQSAVQGSLVASPLSPRSFALLFNESPAAALRLLRLPVAVTDPLPL